MANFLDTFNRPGPLYGNNWRRAPKVDAWRGTALPPFEIKNNRSEAPPEPKWIYHRDHPVPLEGIYEVIWTCSRDKMFAECCVRYTANGGEDAERLSVVIRNGQGFFAYRKGDAGLTNPVAATEVILGGVGWDRIPDADFVIRVTVHGDDIKVYDNNRLTGDPELPVLELTTALCKEQTGIGMGNGFMDQFEIKDFSDNPVSSVMEFSEADIEINASLGVTVDGSTETPYPDAVQRHASLSVPEYLSLSGIPQRWPLHVASSNVDGLLGNEELDTTGAAPDPTLVDTSMLYRFIPRSDDFDAGGIWRPFKGAGGPGNFNMQIHRFAGHDPASELQRYLNYSYRSTYGTLTRRALNFGGHGVMRLVGENYPFIGMTLAMVFIPRPGPYTYGLFSEDREHPHLQAWSQEIDLVRSSSGVEYLARRRFGSRHLRHRSTARANRPILVILSHRADTGLTSLLIQDQRRFYRTFIARSKYDGDDDGTYWNGWVGCKMNFISEFSEARAMRGQLLELALHYDFYDRAKMLELASVMSAMYGVGP